MLYGTLEFVVDAHLSSVVSSGYLLAVLAWSSKLTRERRRDQRRRAR